MKHHGFTGLPYLETLDPGWIHVDTPRRRIVREVYRRLHAGELRERVNRRPANQLPRSEQRAAVKALCRSLLARHAENQQLYRSVMTGRPEEG